MQAGISDDAARMLTLYVASSGNIERIGDYGKKLLEYYAYRQNRPKDFLPAGQRWSSPACTPKPITPL